MNAKEREEKYGLNVYPKRDVMIVRGKGSKVWDENGKEYVDCGLGMGVSNVGHCNDAVIEALYEQSKKLVNCYNIFYNDTRARLMEKLVQIAPGNLHKVFLCNSGTESVEAAIKFARVSTGRQEIIACMRGFHGKTMGSLSATWEKKYKEPFLPLVPEFRHVPYDNIEALKDIISEKTAAVIVEIVQGEGGVRPGSGEYFMNVRKLCDERGALLIVDEVQTGFCRTGRMFACEHFGLEPDMLCAAKSIAGGFPMGVVLCSDNIKVPELSHTNTFGGNPALCAASLAAIEFMEKHRLAENAEKLGGHLMERLRDVKSDKIREVRGLGLMVGIELKEKAGPYVKKLMDKGVIALLAGSFVIRLLPPLVITKDEVDFVADKIGEVLA
jgi:acetylornithine/LysW-gamma-L-lysine aminotransferase